MIGNDTNTNGPLRPKWLVKYPKNILPNKEPIHCSDAIQDVSAIEILPDGNGDLFEFSKNVLGLTQPSNMPNPMLDKLTDKMIKYIHMSERDKVNNELNYPQKQLYTDI